MSNKVIFGLCLTLGLSFSSWLPSQDKSVASSASGKYAYESKPEDPAFEIFNPAKSPGPGGLIVKSGDRLAIVGDSITEQKMYSRMIENYVTACVPHLNVTVRQYGWSGEKTDGFLNRMDKDCLTFEPTLATICYGMNDARYRPFDVTNGRWYRDHYTSIVRKFKERGARVIVGSPGASGKLATWVKSKSGTLEEHNLNLCALRDIALEVASNEQVPFADIFWPMYQAQILAPRRFNKSAEEYAVAGKDGIHPGWAGQVIMAHAFLTAMGFDGDLGTINVDLSADKATVSGMHEIKSFRGGELTLVSTQYPYCAAGAIDDDNSIRSGMQLVPFFEKLSRFQLRVAGHGDKPIKVTWGAQSQTFTAAQASAGINLAEQFVENPFSEAFAKVDEAVLAKQQFETKQVKQLFHSPAAKADFAKVVAESEAERQPLANAVASAVVPITHVIQIE